MSSVTPPRQGRPDASMTLLIEAMERPLDPGYAQAAARRAAAGGAETRGTASLVVILLVGVLLGVVTVTAARQLRAPQSDVAEARDLLVEQITERSTAVDQLMRRSVVLGLEIDALQQAEGVPEEVREAARLDRLANGAVPVTGPGMVVSLTDGGGGLVDPEDIDPESRVRDSDVQTVVNALWAAGAEAIAVNGERLTALSAIRNAGDAILVDLQPLNGPTYSVEAIGDRETLQVEFARSAAPAYLQMLGATFGIQQSIVPQSSITLDGAGSQTLRIARAVRSTVPSPSAVAPSPLLSAITPAPEENQG
ncbi:DUF881 domain-containing protein [Antribacter sp. KLBMP9083]|uniref:DUF881 domain-containing protein n=1 Tax=Antribacter soli TaxID=2910976 RepID=A0AA41QCV3_9MICO|nr:DUF881 domain-containing protein [Antribacter soli]MCF4120776.1 DUF881 domain-containing protein [Antribacter soli]